MKILKHTLIFTIILTMLFATSCTNESVNNNNNDQCTIYPALICTYDTSYNIGDFHISVDSINLDHASMNIALTVKNSSEKIASCDKTFDVERLHDDHWETCKIEEPKYSEHETGIKEMSSSQVIYDLGKTFDIKEPGTYRFKTNIFGDATNKREKNEVSIEFTVAYDSVTPVLESYSISEGSALISVHWNNNSESNIYLTDFYTVQALNDGEWVDCTRTETEFPVSLFAIAPGESAEKHYAIDEMYDMSYYGSYRIYIEYAVDYGDVAETRYSLVEFFVPFEIGFVEFE